VVKVDAIPFHPRPGAPEMVNGHCLIKHDARARQDGQRRLVDLLDLD
jgi:hypothetical protein